jgi:hypothetical protein
VAGCLRDAEGALLSTDLVGRAWVPHTLVAVTWAAAQDQVISSFPFFSFFFQFFSVLQNLIISEKITFFPYMNSC